MGALTDRLIELLIAYARRPFVVRVRRALGETPNDREAAERYGRERIASALASGRNVLLDFTDVNLATQSFFHALLAEVILGDERNADRVSIVNATSSQSAIFNLAVRHMRRTSAERIRVTPVLPKESAHS